MPIPSFVGLTKLAWNHPRYVEHVLIKKLKFFARYKWLEANAGKDDQVPPPLIYKLVLTYKCDLRCTMCYEWGDAGWCKQEHPEAVGEELSWSIVEDLFTQYGKQHPSFILIGGEPLLYSNFERLALTLKENRCFAITCTNGTLLHRFQDVSADNPYLTYLVSLDGLKEENDQLRGRGVYDRVTKNIKLIKSLENPPFVGIQFTIRPENVGVMYEFCREMVKLGVDWILLNLCWFVSEEQAREYEDFMRKHFAITPTSHLGYLLPYELDQEQFVREYKRIKNEKWPIQISCYLEEPEDIHTYVDHPQVPLGNTFCYKQWLRMDITPDGSVTPCVLYPDLTVGNLHEQRVMEIWNSPEYAKFREVRRQEPLPICSKCNALYLYDAKRKIL
jgi:radical SAM protein with 4Fe4S-binding SPASM domain